MATHSCAFEMRLLILLSPRESPWGFFARTPEKLTAREQHSLEQLCQIHEEVALAYQLIQQCALMLRTRKGVQLDSWLDAPLSTPLSDLHAFAKGIRSDIEAVEAALILPWSNGLSKEKLPS